jgi:gas vesicle protein
MLFKKLQERKEAEMRRQKKETIKKVGVALLIGSVVSSVVTLFTAPKSGKEMRQDVADKVDEGAVIVKESASKVAKKTTEVVGEAINKGQELKEKVIVKVNAAKNDIKKNEIVNDAEELADDVKDATGDIFQDIENKFDK